LLGCLGSVAACSTPDSIVPEPVLPGVTATRGALLDLPAPARRYEVAVYGFEDLTGQFKPSENFQTLSRAVTQGGAPVLIKALRDAGNRRWFRVVERAGLNNLLQERKIIAEMRQRYLGETRINPQALPPMLFAGVLIEGGIVGFDSNTVTGGVGARLLGIGGQAEYRHDTISISLRAVSVKTGEVLSSIMVQKSIISAGISASAFKFVDIDEVLEVEAGISTNEPGLVALTRAIEKAVYGLIMEMAETGLWAFADPEAGRALVLEHLVEEGRLAPEEAARIARATSAPSARAARRGGAPQAAPAEAAAPSGARAAATTADAAAPTNRRAGEFAPRPG